MNLKVFIADDHKMFRDGLKAQLGNVNGIAIVGEASNGHDAVRIAQELMPDVVVLDIAMPLLNGIEATRQIRKSLPESKVIVLSMHADHIYVKEAIKAGAHGYLLKEESFEQLVEAVKTIMNGKIYLSKSLEDSMLEDFVRQIRAGELDRTADPLTDRERQILQLIAEGNTSREIADVLNISASTIDTHRKHIMDKLSIHTTAGLVKYAIKHGIVS
ncbi:MAG: response regulator transcription factor [Nitrospirae bacterium]|nr:response regulator transcription factor [Nitrospirota bacterium]